MSDEEIIPVVEQPKDAPAETEESTELKADEQAAEGEESEDKAKTEAEDGDDEDAEPEKPKKESRSARYQRQIERLRAENAELRGGRAGGEPSVRDVADEVERLVGKPPQEADFKGDYLAFERAMTAYEVDKRQTTREEQRRIERAVNARNVVREAAAYEHQERIDEFREQVKDFDQVLAKASSLKAAPIVEDLILESDKSAHLVYYLAKNARELAHL